MRAVVIEKFGDPSGMAVREVADPPPPVAGQVVIGTEAIGVGGVDAVIRRGTLGGYGFAEGLIPGSEVAGTVTAVGRDVDPYWLGRRVWAFTGTGGGYAEQATARIDDITPLPDGLTAVDAVTLGSAATVAHFALAHAHSAPGESVLVRGAAGSIGIAAVELAARGGAGLIAVTTSSAERGRRLRELGATLVLDRAGHGDDDEHADRAEPAMFDVVIDIVGGPAVGEFIDRLKPNGRMIVVGIVAGLPPADFGMRLMHSFQRSRSFATFSLNTVPVPERNAVRAELLDAAATGRLHPVVHEVLPLDHAAEAHRQMDDGTVFGRIVLTP
ncbi:zinc-dependent alcohol dehydrogenase family protein [Actinospica sp. MGRD01-02]|uniref:Zinc-dependent alcohol dehydrogenase family protein n=1 Tax=Actinospica acidithermotolerans TaxID=2828514 RepID=A0A941IIN3_9ACTN|nr:zinc-dependent alcohol dehydrogenase family protein [Actinospica acidithermotolerans]MBR7826977.1 zinc-dependent alcohol dehydrogenase family protein [Actinospica acidithermotolerans]